MRWTSFQNLIVLPHTLFGLPWLVTSASLVLIDPLLRPQGRSMIWTVFLMVVAFVAARIAGMSFNRLIDHRYDALNPRTRDRALPRGKVRREQVEKIAWGSIAVFILACGLINLTCLALAPLMVALLWGYSYVKRVSPLYHVIMALNHFFIPIFAWAAITGSIGMPAVYLGLAILCLIAANDIIYSLQDVDFDQSHGLHSVATALGEPRSLLLARALHVLFLLLLVDVAMLLNASQFFYLGIAVIAGLLVYLHRSLNIRISDSVTVFMFQCNVWVGFALMFFSIGTVAWQRLS